jgi:hypothetical protein
MAEKRAKDKGLTELENVKPSWEKLNQEEVVKPIKPKDKCRTHCIRLTLIICPNLRIQLVVKKCST